MKAFANFFRIYGNNLALCVQWNRHVVLAAGRINFAFICTFALKIRISIDVTHLARSKNFNFLSKLLSEFDDKSFSISILPYEFNLTMRIWLHRKYSQMLIHFQNGRHTDWTISLSSSDTNTYSISYTCTQYFNAYTQRIRKCSSTHRFSYFIAYISSLSLVRLCDSKHVVIWNSDTKPPYCLNTILSHSTQRNFVFI